MDVMKNHRLGFPKLTDSVGWLVYMGGFQSAADYAAEFLDLSPSRKITPARILYCAFEPHLALPHALASGGRMSGEKLGRPLVLCRACQ
jgi:hypothetical protein